MNRSKTKEAIEEVAKEENITEIEAITRMQAGAAIINDEEILEILCDIKWDYI